MDKAGDPQPDILAMIKAAVSRQQRREAYRASKRADAAFFRKLSEQNRSDDA